MLSHESEGRAKTSFPVITAIPVWKQPAQGGEVCSKRRRAHKKAAVLPVGTQESTLW